VLDPVTGLSNRQGLEMVAGPMLENARRSGQAVHCLFVDVDDFRTVNEHVGLQAGDAVLQSVAEAVLGSVRGTDVVARWAGDEFVVIGPGTGTSPLELERRVKAQLAASPPVPAQVWTGRVSIGSATLVPWDDGDLDSLLRRADQDMVLRRSLRRQGRDRVSGLQGPLAAAREVAVDDEDDAPARIVDGDASA
jgi:diguanylate cyclase (GGDEF)-like protein